MISTRWLDRRKDGWSRLEQLVNQSRIRGISALRHRELQELGLLYRQTATDLAVVREDPSSRQLADYLNQLLGRAHNLIYMGHRSKMNSLWRFYAETYPQIFRETLPATLLASGIFLAAAIAACLVTLRDPHFAHRLLGQSMMETIERHEMWTHSIVTIKPLAASAIMTNNLSVSFAAFASGITGGILTIWMMALNGLLLGTVSAATWRAGMALQFWSFVAPHGVLELPAICIAGGAGFKIAQGLLFPGMLPRKKSLVEAGSKASRLVLGTIPMLFIAGVIEGFLSPSDTSIPVKFIFAAVLFAALILYLNTSRSVSDKVAIPDLIPLPQNPVSN
jgi:uncharacterized membrane protein SpoIIM required for sporulation